MKNMEFGQLLDKLLYLSNQKKSALAKELGYDISYISKWINGKNLPTQKSIYNVCKVAAEFIVKSLNPITKKELKHYFEIEAKIEDDKKLSLFIERSLHDSYMSTAQKSSPNICKNTQSEENYNSMVHVNPKLRKQYLTNDINLYVNNTNKLDLILSTNLYKLEGTDKVHIAEMKSSLAEIDKTTKVKARLLTGFEGKDKDIFMNTLLLINMITRYPNLDFEIYNCNVDDGNILSVVKDRIFHSAIYASNGRCLFTNMTKEKSVVEEVYYSLDEILKNKSKLLVEKKSPINMLKDKTYIQYIMGQNLKWILGSINEFFMPSDLFMEVAESIVGEDELLLKELRKIDTFLQNITYKSNIKILIYESELIKYISTGEITFFNMPVKLTLNQIERHVKNIEKIITSYEGVEIKLIEGSFVPGIDSDSKPSIYLSKHLKLIKTNPEGKTNDYAIVKDVEFMQVCDELFNRGWEDRQEILVSEKSDILERILKTLTYARIINGDMD